MTVDYIVASLPTLVFGEPPALSRERFESEYLDAAAKKLVDGKWAELETQLRNAICEARGGAEKFRRETPGCSIYWKNRVLACFQEKDPAKREEALDRVRWDAAAELTSVTDPLGAGALATYAVRLSIAMKRAAISKENGNAAFDRLTAATKMEF